MDSLGELRRRHMCVEGPAGYAEFDIPGFIEAPFNNQLAAGVQDPNEIVGPAASDQTVYQQYLFA